MNRKNLIAVACVFAVMGMTGAAFAAVPLYRMFILDVAERLERATA